ncbi:hypothetical protein Pmani_016070 [Petrolisthes manimaculis]|uniref:MIF4G domain-containing protein n=1 Tax=Petrolisthes manimaculis TaxID=1843537 RepID=A0AAE1PSH0_9EUCA|nr:hypothetical protein Pmani_016070 [Petrolisthes manimaculis]
MDESYVSADADCNLEIEECLEAKMGSSQDLELLAQEIAEAAVEDEKRSSSTPSPTSTSPEHSTTHETPLESHKGQEDTTEIQQEEQKPSRSGTPVDDETSWVMVDSEEHDEMNMSMQDNDTHVTEQDDDENTNTNSQDNEESITVQDNTTDTTITTSRSPEHTASVYRKFLARGDLAQKLSGLGLVCEGEEHRCQGETVRLQDLVMSCSESMVICDLPQEGGDAAVAGELSQVLLKDPPDGPSTPGWRGSFSGATVSVCVERQGGLLVAGVRVWHVDLLSALASLQHLVSSAGLVHHRPRLVPTVLPKVPSSECSATKANDAVVTLLAGIMAPLHIHRCHSHRSPGAKIILHQPLTVSPWRASSGSGPCTHLSPAKFTLVTQTLAVVLCEAFCQQLYTSTTTTLHTHTHTNNKQHIIIIILFHWGCLSATMPEGPDVEIEGEGGEGQQGLHRCDNPWKPNAQHGQSEVYRRMLGILNRVTQQSLGIFLEQARELPLSDPTHLPHILSLLLEKSQDEPMFAPIYARLCRDLAASAGIQRDLTIACEAHFMENYEQLLHYNNIFEGPISSQLLHEEILVRKRFIGHLKFMSELHKVGVVPSDQVAAMAETLLAHGDDRSFEGLCRLLSFTGLSLTRTHEELVERSCNYLETCFANGTLNPRLRFLTQDTLDLRANGWRLREGNRGHHPSGRNVRG